MIRKRKIHKPFDFSFGIMYNEFPKELHEELHIPGIFKRKSNVKVRFNKGTVLEMDASYVVDPDFVELFEPAVVDLEHQSTPVDEPKIIVIGDYNIQQIADERLPPLNVIASHLDEDMSVKEYERTPSFITRLLFLDLNRENIKKRLSTVSDIINYHEEQLSVNHALNLGIIVLFAPRDNACEITRRVVSLYNSIKNKPKKLEYVLYSVITAMIDAFFDDETEFKELMDMINNETEDEIIEKFETEIISENKIIELQNENEAYASEISQLRSENDVVVAENSQLKSEIEELKNQLKNK